MATKLTSQQAQALKTDITVTRVAVPWEGSTLGSLFSSGNLDAVSRFYNQLHDPDFWVRRTSISKHEIYYTTGPDGTSFTFAGNGLVSRTAGEQSVWFDMFDRVGMLNPSFPNVVPALQDIFSGVGNAAANRTHIQAKFRRKATYSERLFVTSGTGTTTDHGFMAVEGALTVDDLVAARDV